MLEQITKLLEQYNIPADIMSQITEKLGDGFQINDVVDIVKNNQEAITNSSDLVSKLEGLGGAGDLLSKAKGYLGM